jgi:hypothetical protein
MMRRQSRIGPVEGSYWVHDRLLAGEYPGGWDEQSLKVRLRGLLTAGVTYFLDLTEEREKGLRLYAPALREIAREIGRAVEHCRMPIPDFETPSVKQMRAILDTLDAALADGHTVYVHCYAGIGRTGTVVGCYLVRHGQGGQGALDELVRLRRGTVLEGAFSPATEEQRRLLYNWATLDRQS